MHIKTSVDNKTANASQVKLVTRIVNAQGTETAKAESAQTIEAGNVFEFSQEATVPSPQLWSTDSPILYTAVTEVNIDGKLSDREETKFGIRTISFDAVHGFMLNGKTDEAERWLRAS